MTNPLVVVTGAAGALGSAVVRAQIAAGASVAAVDVPQAAARLQALCAELGPRALALDVSAGWPSLLARIASDLGGAPTGAVLVAGGWQGGAPLHAADDDSVFTQMQQMNVDTAYHALRALLPGMVGNGRGSIVVIGSRAVERPWESAGAAAYAASKSAVVALARAVAAETLGHGVRVNAVLPSTIDTAANRAAMPDADASRWVGTDSLAGVIGFLLSDAARDISGAVVPVYGRA